MFLCNSCQPMHFFWYASTICCLADAVVIFLISATADTILLFCPTSTAHSRCIGDAHTILRFLLSVDPSDSSCFPYRSNMADQSLVFSSLSTHFYQPIYRLRDRLYTYGSHTLNHTPISCTSVKHILLDTSPSATSSSSKSTLVVSLA
jgi:hypothetical protein